MLHRIDPIGNLNRVVRHRPDRRLLDVLDILIDSTKPVVDVAHRDPRRPQTLDLLVPRDRFIGQPIDQSLAILVGQELFRLPRLPPTTHPRNLVLLEVGKRLIHHLSTLDKEVLLRQHLFGISDRYGGQRCGVCCLLNLVGFRGQLKIRIHLFPNNLRQFLGLDLGEVVAGVPRIHALIERICEQFVLFSQVLDLGAPVELGFPHDSLIVLEFGFNPFHDAGGFEIALSVHVNKRLVVDLCIHDGVEKLVSTATRCLFDSTAPELVALHGWSIISEAGDLLSTSVRDQVVNR